MTHSAALNYKAIVRILGTILFIIGISMIIPWLYAEFAKEPESARAFRICAPITAVFGLLIMVTIKNHTVKFRSREGYLVVALCWLIASIAGAFPYYISGHAGTFLDAIFESTAGFTTTGCTSINAEYTEQSLVLWKAISHWLGGMGILVLRHFHPACTGDKRAVYRTRRIARPCSGKNDSAHERFCQDPLSDILYLHSTGIHTADAFRQNAGIRCSCQYHGQHQYRRSSGASGRDHSLRQSLCGNRDFRFLHPVISQLRVVSLPDHRKTGISV